MQISSSPPLYCSASRNSGGGGSRKSIIDHPVDPEMFTDVGGGGGGEGEEWGVGMGISKSVREGDEWEYG